MADMTQPTHARIQVINDIRSLYLGAGGTINIGLYKAALVPSAATSLATFLANECSFPGYARQAGGFGAAVDNGSGDGHTYSSLVTFTRGAGAGGDSVGGIFVVASDVTNTAKMILLYKNFTSPVDMTVAGTSLRRLIEWLQGQYPIT